MKKILASGSIAMDVVLNSSDLPVNDGFALIKHESMQPGGSSANVAVSAAGFGLEAYQTGKVGDDDMGAKFRASLIKDGVNDKYLYTKKDGVTMHTYIITAPEGKHTIFAHLGDCMQDFNPAELPEDILDDIDILYTDMFSANVSLYLAEKAAALNKKVVFNMQAVPSFMPLCGTNMDQLEKIFSIASLIVGGKDSFLELGANTGSTDIDAIVKDVCEKNNVSDGVICTLGEEGAVWYSGNGYVRASAYHVMPVDTTGAGDCFLGGLMYSYYDHLSLIHI